jgi:hypothetical protein
MLSSDPINLAAGCVDADDVTCAERDISRPGVHFSVETWAYGIGRANALPFTVRPVIVAVQNYKTTDGAYIWKSTLDAGLRSPEHLFLNQYTSYDAGFYKPFKFFDPWTRILELLPAEHISPCSENTPGSYLDLFPYYLRYTNDTNPSCSYNDTVWFSPACRANTTECVPVLLQYNFGATMQRAVFHRLPLAIVGARLGGAHTDAYYAAIRAGRFVFGWYQPDDSLVDSGGNLPVALGFPPNNPLEWSQNNYRTGYNFSPPTHSLFLPPPLSPLAPSRTGPLPQDHPPRVDLE